MAGIVYILADFGGPRDLEEIPSFLKELLLDPEVIRPKLPKPLHYILFSQIVKKRAKKIAKEYEKLGGRSPLFDYTEKLAKRLSVELLSEVIPFHRYLPKTHQEFINRISSLSCQEIRVFPLFPQFTYAVTGSIARFFDRSLPKEKVRLMRWVKSYPAATTFLQAHKENLQDFLAKNGIRENEAFFLFSCHGIPKSYAEEGDIYEMECQYSFHHLLAQFPKAKGLLAYQSRFGKEEWLKPYTEAVCLNILSYAEGLKKIVVVPLSFVSDHIETLFEIEELYLPLLRKQDLLAYRCPALNFHPAWEKSILSLIKEPDFVSNQMLMRKP